MELAFASLHQLCAPVLDRLETLPAPQRDALQIVFGLNAGPPPDRFLVGLGVLSLFSEVAEERPLLCVVDDAQWLDQASALTLAFVSRRLLAEPVGIVFAARDPGEELQHISELEVHGVRDGDARVLLSSVVRFKLDERVRDRIIAETHGNPLALLELPRGLTATQLAGPVRPYRPTARAATAPRRTSHLAETAPAACQPLHGAQAGRLARPSRLGEAHAMLQRRDDGTVRRKARHVGPGVASVCFPVVERSYSDEASFPTVGLANLHAVVPGIEENKAKIERACRQFKDHGVNVAIFPEFCLSGYFWDDEDACRDYMEQAVTERHLDWIDGALRPLMDDSFRAIVLNNLAHGNGDKFRNTTSIVTDEIADPLAEEFSYDKVFLPGIEKTYTESGRDDRLIVTGRSSGERLGFTTCYDYLFNDLLREYAFGDDVDAIIEVASWRAAATRDYAGMNVRTDLYYGELWDNILATASATNQVWTIACNAVGRHGVSGVAFWGGSGIWAPSGLKLIQASHFNEELVVVHNIDVASARRQEKDDYNYAFDFSEVYRPMDNGYGFTRRVALTGGA